MDSQFFASLGAAFVGGVILNAMPCVLPVLTMKVFQVIKKGQEAPAENRRHGVAYSLGILFAFGVFAAIVIGLKMSGELMAWGMQFGNPLFVAALCITMLVFGLNGLGVFEFSVSVQGGASEGYAGSFINGIVASLMSTPCSAPFLSVAVAYAFAADTVPWKTFLIFEMVGLGLAVPFGIISFWPGAGRFLPKPGAWMETFKQLMGFSLLAAAAWLFSVMLAQITTDSASWFLGYLLLIGIGLWSVTRFGGLEHANARRYGVRVVVLAVWIVAGNWMLQFDSVEAEVASQPARAEHVAVIDGRINWVSFDEGRVSLERRRQRPVFVDYTAEWCLNCQTLEETVLETDRIRGAFTETGVLPMQADWTSPGSETGQRITEWLRDLGKSAIPVYAIYMPDGSFDLLPDVITADIVEERLQAASERYPSDSYRSLEEACLMPNP